MKKDSPDVFIYERFKIDEKTGELWGYYLDWDGSENCEPVTKGKRITEIVADMLEVISWLYEYQSQQSKKSKLPVSAKYRTREDEKK